MINKGSFFVKLLLGLVMGVWYLGACVSPPEFPVIPRIEFDEVLFKAGVDDNDSLIVKIKFEDGDGDLGLSPSEDAPPFNRLFFFSKENGQILDPSPSNLEDLIRYSNRSTIDSLPPFASPYNCINWIINPNINDATLHDTLYYQTNPRHFNMFIDFYVLEEGNFRWFNWPQEFPYPNCGTPYYVRFPLIEGASNGPMQGTLRYAMVSPGFEFLFSNRTLKLRIRILDRAGNYSNQVEYGPFTLNDVRQ
jgi:hypothetical protein